MASKSLGKGKLKKTSKSKKNPSSGNPENLLALRSTLKEGYKLDEDNLSSSSSSDECEKLPEIMTSSDKTSDSGFNVARRNSSVIEIPSIMPNADSSSDEEPNEQELISRQEKCSSGNHVIPVAEALATLKSEKDARVDHSVGAMARRGPVSDQTAEQESIPGDVKPKQSEDNLPKMADFLPDIKARIESLKKPSKHQKGKTKGDREEEEEHKAPEQ